MADVKISQLPAATTPLAGTEEIPLVQSGTTKKATVDDVIAGAVLPGGPLGTPSSGVATNLTGLPLTTGVTGVLPVANGGNGTATPSLVAGTNIAVSGTWPNQTITATGTAAGNVVGPSSATDNAVARFDLTTGKIIQNSTVLIDDNGNVTQPLSVTMANGSAVTLAAGRMWYDGSTGSWNLGMGGGNITQQVGEELFVYGKASAAITDSPLQIVYQTGTVGGSGVITFGPTIAGITNGDLIIGAATESLALNAFGRITAFGVIHGITTDGTAYGETWADGDTIWYNPTTGNPTKTKPSAPNIKVAVGTVIKAGSGGSGSFQVEVNHGSVLGGTDSNVQLTSVADTQLLQYYAAGGYWRNVNPSSVTVGNVSGTVAIANGGTAATTAAGARTSLAVAGLADANTFTTNQVISDNSANAALRITQIGAGNALLVEDSANPDSTPFVVTTDGRAVIGGTSPVAPVSGITPWLQMQGSTSATSTMSAMRFSADANQPYQIFAKTRSATVGTFGTIVQSGDSLGTVLFTGDDGSSTPIQAASITAAVDGTPGTNDMPGRLVFSTTKDGAASPTEAVRIDNQQQVGIGGTPSAGRTLEVLKNITGATTSSAVRAAGVIQSDVTSQTRYFAATSSTAAASFTLSSLPLFYAAQGTFGAGSTVTSQYGYLADSTLTGATNNYGFYSNLASGTGVWNFYAAGTAANYFAGQVGVGVAPVAANGILQLGSYASVQTLLEKATVTSAAPSATQNFDAVTQSVQYFTTNAANNWTLNVRGNSTTTLDSIMQVGQSITIAVLTTQGSTAYYQSAFQVDGSSVTPKWQGGTAPTSGNASAIDVYSITVIKTASATFTALIAQTKFA